MLREARSPYRARSHARLRLDSDRVIVVRAEVVYAENHVYMPDHHLRLLHFSDLHPFHSHAVYTKHDKTDRFKALKAVNPFFSPNFV